MLILDERYKIGSGVDRVVYVHPEDSDVCIKIARHNIKEEFHLSGVRDYIFWALRFFRKEYFDFNFNDVLYASKLAEKDDLEETFRHLPRCFGYVRTNLGEGVSWQRIRNYDGSNCISLRDYYLKPDLQKIIDKKKLWNALDDFFRWQKENGIMLREMAFSNTLVRCLDKDTISIYHIDAIGCVDLIPLADYIQWFAKIRVMSKIRRFRAQLEKLIGR